MGGKIRIDGATHNTQPGKVLVNGTKYQIQQGKTRIDGTVYNIFLYNVPIGKNWVWKFTDDYRHEDEEYEWECPITGTYMIAGTAGGAGYSQQPGMASTNGMAGACGSMKVKFTKGEKLKIFNKGAVHVPSQGGYHPSRAASGNLTLTVGTENIAVFAGGSGPASASGVNEDRYPKITIGSRATDLNRVNAGAYSRIEKLIPSSISTVCFTYIGSPESSTRTEYHYGDGAGYDLSPNDNDPNPDNRHPGMLYIELQSYS